MPIQIGDNFKYQGKKPLDGRILYSTVADMVAMSEASLYEGCKAYVTATGKEYRYKAGNTVDSTLGKWREETGGGVSDFDDLTNRPQESDAIDIDDLDLPMPAKPTEYPVLFDETGAEYQVGLYKRASDGKVKPVYQKTILFTASGTGNDWYSDIATLSDIDKMVSCVGNGIETDAAYPLPNNVCRFRFSRSGASADTLRIVISGSWNFISGSFVTLQYTKTTDSWKEV